MMQQVRSRRDREKAAFAVRPVISEVVRFVYLFTGHALLLLPPRGRLCHFHPRFRSLSQHGRRARRPSTPQCQCNRCRLQNHYSHRRGQKARPGARRSHWVSLSLPITLYLSLNTIQLRVRRTMGCRHYHDRLPHPHVLSLDLPGVLRRSARVPELCR